jgi:hypothetical protein
VCQPTATVIFPDAFRLAIFGLAWVEYEKEEAKKRQAELNGKTQLPVIFPEAEKGDSRDKVGERVGVSGRSIDKSANKS